MKAKMYYVVTDFWQESWNESNQNPKKYMRKDWI